ncbi:MAG: TatD family hydrolase [Dissulfuribacterales bacterium]
MQPLLDSLSNVMHRAAANGVEQVMTIGVDLLSSQKAMELAAMWPQVFCAVGIHPHDAARIPSFEWLQNQLNAIRLQDTSNKIKAIGETGLDFAKEYSPRAEQFHAFRWHLELALEWGLPVVVHDREAHGQTLDVLAEYAARGLTGVLHCFSGDTEMARRVLDMGFHVSVSGVVTFSKADVLREAVRFTPLDRLLIETDSPFLAPVPYRGKTNEPGYVRYVAEEIARLKCLTLEEVASCTTRNAQALFALPSL